MSAQGKRTPTRHRAQRRLLSFRERVRNVAVGQWPILLVCLMIIAAFGLVIAGYWRRGSLGIGIAVAVAAALRLTLSEDRAGLLAVRSRGIDFLTMSTVAATMLYVAWTIDPLGTK